MSNKQEIIDILIEQIKDDMLSGDCTVLDELLQRIPVDTLIQSLPEETKMLSKLIVRNAVMKRLS